MRAVRLSAGREIGCSEADLRAEGIACDSFEVAQIAAATQHAQSTRGWSEADRVRRSASRPQDEVEIVREADEHCHLEEEVRLFVEGEGLYDIRGRDEQWIRVFVRAGDLVVVPARRYHRFLVGQAAELSYVQPFGNRPSLIQLYRVSDDATRAG
ncbi:1,2-dihydroxy-3-keto-5-methylthiopentene dioxygenase [Chondromyces apiculatus]|uniref:acireductone dioxygenase (Fe(2+)-requiring) n=1 Tax=Chondromyces apiculatus DSM 436 TaxID=1192034 RepID=A0A017SX73_9BACT|nr:cupin domain-containing protein [Chondromyces apiculatus]EYF00926.1 1,2-dihydroxy-3-keto-5-methylthiopentene dioxygenase [Chondromyces apiculatus DSM 436]